MMANKRRLVMAPPQSPTAVSLVKDLLKLTQELEFCERSKISQQRNVSSLIRTMKLYRIKLLGPLCEEISKCQPLLLPSPVMRLRELHILIQRAIILKLDDCREKSVLLCLMRNKEVSSQRCYKVTHEIASPIRTSIAIDISLDFKERYATYRSYAKQRLMLENELSNQVEDMEALIIVRNLISVVSYCKFVFYGVLDAKSEDVLSFNVPEDYKCPISLELMQDPVIVSTGQTYDRSSIQRWIDSGRCTCPKTGEKLASVTLVSNYALRSLIQQWCKEHKVPYAFAEKYSLAAETSRMTVAFLIEKFKSLYPEVQQKVAFELRLLVKCGTKNRMIIAEVRSFPLLVTLLASEYQKKDDYVTALINLSILESNSLTKNCSNSGSGLSLNVPKEYKCPLSLKLMQDPIIVSTGQTYDRTSFQRWINSGHSTCPKTGEWLASLTFVSNYALRSSIQQWWQEHKVFYGNHENIDSVTMRMTVAFLIEKFKSGNPEVKKQVAYDLRLLAKCEKENRMIIAEAGGISLLVLLLKEITGQENDPTQRQIIRFLIGGDNNNKWKSGSLSWVNSRKHESIRRTKRAAKENISSPLKEKTSLDITSYFEPAARKKTNVS